MTIPPTKHNVQYYETDQMGIVHHSNYIRWFEEARVAQMDHLGLNYKAIEEAGVFMPVLDITCQYKQSARFGDEVWVRMVVEAFNNIKLRLGYRITDVQGEILYATGTSSHCFLDRTSGRPIRIDRSHPWIAAGFAQMRAATSQD